MKTIDVRCPYCDKHHFESVWVEVFEPVSTIAEDQLESLLSAESEALLEIERLNTEIAKYKQKAELLPVIDLQNFMIAIESHTKSLVMHQTEVLNEIRVCNGNISAAWALLETLSHSLKDHWTNFYNNFLYICGGIDKVETGFRRIFG